jgi:glycosyltransferase involved in cell wall biosynthesis
MTTDTLGGVFSYAVELARVLCADGHSVLLASTGPRATAAQLAELEGLVGLELAQSDYALEWMPNPWSDVDAAGAWLLELARSFRPDVVHSNGFSFGALPWSVPCLVVAHSCVGSWWQAVHGEQLPAGFNEYRARVRAGLAQADAVVAPSHAMLGALQEQYGPVRNAHVIENGVDPQRFLPGHKRPVFLAAGRFADAAKNLSAIRRAAPALPWPVRIAGANGLAADEECENLSLLGALSRNALAGELGRASVFLHPARYEPFGLVALEAALSRCALVLGNTASLREIWGDAALYVEPDDALDLVHQATRLASDEGLRAELAQLARERALSLSAARCGAAYSSLYRRLLNCRGPSGAAVLGASMLRLVQVIGSW